MSNAAVDVETPINIDTVGTGTSKQITVLPGQSTLRRIIASVARATLVASVGVNLILILKGTGIQSAIPVEIPIGYHVEDTTTTGGAKQGNPFVLEGVDIPLNVGGTIDMTVVAKGTDAGNEEVTIGLDVQ